MMSALEHQVAQSLRAIIYRPAKPSESVTLIRIQVKEKMAYPGELVYPRRMDLQFALPRRNRGHFFLNIEINKRAAYNELKRSRMLDPHLVERCDRIYGHSNYLNVMLAGGCVKLNTQRSRELARYFEPNRNFNLWVIPCSEDFTRADLRDVGEKLRDMSRKIMGLE